MWLRRHCMSVGSQLFLLLYCWGSTLAQEAPGDLAYLTVRLNGLPRGERLLWITADGQSFMRLEELAGLGVDVAGLPVETWDDAQWVALPAAGESLWASLSPETLILELNVDPARLGYTRVGGGSAPTPTAEHGTAGSAFMNYGLSGQCAAPAGRCALQASTELGATFLDLLAVTELRYRTPDIGLVRGHSYLNKDVPSWRARLRVGDVVGHSGGLGSGGVLGGIGLWTESAVAPHFARHFLAPFSGTVATPAQVEVFINDRLVQRHQVPAGRFEISDLRPIMGVGELKVRTRDASGRERTWVESYLQAPTLLGPGVQDFGIYLGAKRDRLYSESFDYGGPTFFAHYRRGLLHGLSVGGGAEGSLEVLQGSVEASGSLLDRWLLSVVGGASVQEAGVGAAARWVNEWRWTQWSLGMDLAYFTQAYSTVAQPSQRHGGERRGLGRLSAAFSQPSWGSVRLAGSAALDYQDDVNVRVSGTYTKNLFSGANLSLMASLDRPMAGGQWQAVQGQVMASLSYVPTRGVSALIKQETDLVERVRTSVRVQRQADVEHPWGGSLTMKVQHPLSHAGTSSSELEGRGSYRGQVAVADVEVSHSSAGRTWAAASVSGGVAWVGGSLFASQHIHDAYALVKVGTLPRVRVTYDHRTVGLTNDAGELLVPHLRAYQVNRLGVDQRDIPFTYEVARASQQVVPHYRAGVVVDFAAQPYSAVSGWLVDAEGSPLALGTVRVVAGAESALGPTGRKGEFFLEKIAPGAVDLAVFAQGRRYRCRLVVAEVAEVEYEVGEVSCEAVE